MLTTFPPPSSSQLQHSIAASPGRNAEMSQNSNVVFKIRHIQFNTMSLFLGSFINPGTVGYVGRFLKVLFRYYSRQQTCNWYMHAYKRKT